MTRIAKLYTRAVASPAGLSFQEFERLLTAFGFALESVSSQSPSV